MQKINVRVDDDTKTRLYDQLKLYLSFVGILFRFLRVRKFIIAELIFTKPFLPFNPPFWFFISFNNTSKHKKIK